MYKQLTKPITIKKPGGSNINSSINYIQLSNKYNELVSQMSIGDTIDNNTITSVEQAAYTILSTESKDLHVLSMLSTVWIIKNNIIGLADTIAVIHDYIVSNWDHIYPGTTEDDYCDKRGNIVQKIFKQAYQTIHYSIKNNTHSDKKEIAIFNAAINIHNQEDIRKCKVTILNNPSKAQTTKEYIEKCVWLTKEIYDKINEHHSNTEETINVENNLMYNQLLAIDHLINKLIQDHKISNSDTNNHDVPVHHSTKTSQELIEQIIFCTTKLLEDPNHKLLACSIMYMIKAINVDSLQLIHNLQGNTLLKELINTIITEENNSTSNNKGQNTDLDY